MNTAESIADVLEEMARRCAVLKDQLRKLEEAYKREIDRCCALERENAEKDEAYRRHCRIIQRVTHQRDMARLALTDIHQSLSAVRDDAENGRLEGGEVILEALRHIQRGLTLSAQDDTTAKADGKGVDA